MTATLILIFMLLHLLVWFQWVHAARRAERAARQRDALLAALRKWMPELRAHTQASHLTDGFRPRRNRYDDDLDQAVQAIQQATDTKGNP
jgi:hypothetical protein